MNTLIIPVIILIAILICLVTFRETVSEWDVIVKIGIFSVIVATIGSIIGFFQQEGYIVEIIAIICIIMSIIIKLCSLLFKSVRGIIYRIMVCSLFLVLLCTALVYSNNLLSLDYEIIGYINQVRMASLVVLCICILIKSFKLIFGKKDKYTDDSYINNENKIQ